MKQVGHLKNILKPVIRIEYHFRFIAPYRIFSPFQCLLHGAAWQIRFYQDYTSAAKNVVQAYHLNLYIAPLGNAARGGRERFPRRLKPRHPDYETEYELLRKMIRRFEPPPRAKVVVVRADASLE